MGSCTCPSCEDVHGRVSVEGFSHVSLSYHEPIREMWEPKEECLHSYLYILPVLLVICMYARSCVSSAIVSASDTYALMYVFILWFVIPMTSGFSHLSSLVKRNRVCLVTLQNQLTPGSLFFSRSFKLATTAAHIRCVSTRLKSLGEFSSPDHLIDVYSM